VDDNAPRWSTLFVTGGGSGIGRHLACTLAAEGTAIAVFDQQISQDAREAIRRSRRGSDQRLAFEEVDVRDAPALAAAVQRAALEVGSPRLAVNSAGLSRNARFAESTLDDFELTIGVNLVGSRNFAAAVLPHMGRGARLALIASLAGITGGYTYAAYASSKAGVIGLARVLRLECAPEGVGVSVICPPEIVTPMVERAMLDMHPATRALKDVAGTLPIEEACDEMLDQLRRGRFMVLPGRGARRAARLTRYLPDRLSAALADRIVRRAMRTTAGRPAGPPG
jgi:NAD(P)-dependent dehydrogenase (short-subunit alcohol dehydrogenase family)